MRGYTVWTAKSSSSTFGELEGDNGLDGAGISCCGGGAAGLAATAFAFGSAFDFGGVLGAGADAFGGVLGERSSGGAEDGASGGAEGGAAGGSQGGRSPMRSATGTPSRCGASVSDGISSSMISAKERMHDWKNCSVMLTDLEPRLPLQKLARVRYIEMTSGLLAFN